MHTLGTNTAFLYHSFNQLFEKVSIATLMYTKKPAENQVFLNV